MGLLTILAGLVGAPAATFVVAVPIRLLARLLGVAALQKPAVSALAAHGLAVLLLLLVVARVADWRGLGAVPAS